MAGKEQRRGRFLKKRDRLTPAARVRRSALIHRQILRRPEWKRARTVLSYVSFRSEVETRPLIREALKQNKRIVVPVLQTDRKKIALSELHAMEDLAPGAFPGLLEPAAHSRKDVDPSEVELALVPGVAFDRQGGRIGLGGGYFDRLLAQMPDARRMGLAFSVQVSPEPLPLDAHDVRMHTIVTEKEVINISMSLPLKKGGARGSATRRALSARSVEEILPRQIPLNPPFPKGEK